MRRRDRRTRCLPPLPRARAWGGSGLFGSVRRREKIATDVAPTTSREWERRESRSSAATPGAASLPGHDAQRRRKEAMRDERRDEHGIVQPSRHRPVPAWPRSSLNGRLSAILGPGVYWSFNGLGRKQYRGRGRHRAGSEVPEGRRVRAREPSIDRRPWLEAGRRSASTKSAVVYKDGKLSAILSPGSRQVYWKGPVAALRVELVDIGAEMVVPESLVRALAAAGLDVAVARSPGGRDRAPRSAGASRRACCSSTASWARVEAGRLRLLELPEERRAEVIELRVQSIEVSGQELLTRDKVVCA